MSSAVIDWVESPLGPLVLGATAAGVCLVEFSNKRSLAADMARAQDQLGEEDSSAVRQHLAQVKKELEEYFTGKRVAFGVPIVCRGTAFQNAVWKSLMKIPYGQTRSYGEVARAVRAPGAARAVGQANGQNRVAILIPCHRVVASGGRLGGYGAGLWRKEFLLDLERRTAREEP
jgi:AraC family transcriptional regulator of adaptative response/methylated-DNA-[protein]-cysteine methyltransferase